MSDRGLKPEPGFWAGDVQSNGVCREVHALVVAERDSLKAQQEKLLLALEAVDFAIGMEKYLHDSFAWKNLRQEIQQVIAKAKVGQP